MRSKYQSKRNLQVIGVIAMVAAVVFLNGLMNPELRVVVMGRNAIAGVGLAK